MPQSLPSALIAARLLARRDQSPGGLIYGCASERRASDIARLLSELEPGAPVRLLPGWDCLPYDRASPSADVMGARWATLKLLAEGGERPIVVAAPEALLLRTPPRSVLQSARLELRRGEAIDLPDLEQRLRRWGYRTDDVVDEPGEFVVRGEVVDIYSASDSRPLRVEVLEGRIAAIRPYDPLTQRTRDEVESAVLLPASDALTADDEPADARPAGLEHSLGALYPELSSVFGLAPGAELLLEPRFGERAEQLLEQVASAHAERLRFAAAAGEEATRPPSAPETLYLTSPEWADHVARAGQLDEAGAAATPRFALERSPGRALARFVAEQAEAGRRIVLGSVAPRDRARLVAAAERGAAGKAAPVQRWSEALAAEPGARLTLTIDADAGFVDEAAGVVLVAAADLLGSRAQSGASATVRVTGFAAEQELAVGDAVVHADHGLGVLRGLESLDTEAVGHRETVRLEYAREARLLAPVDELDRIWRYGTEDAGVSLDRLDTDAWAKKRQELEGAVAHTARDLVALAKARQEASAPKLAPTQREYERFVAGFPYSLTPDQQSAVDAVLADLVAGRPMDRLVVGDVGFGKTEVALRAAAAAVLAGKQVAVAAPTTVLVRQHVETFHRRFAELGIPACHLSRLVTAAEVKAVKAGLADGTARLVVGTHALTGKGVEFAELGLLIIDEEHRFGAADKAKLKALGEGVHTLMLSATPIPRTLQSALVGLQDLSVIATPPARRRPIRTFTEVFDPATVKTALTRERTRGGQSFVVVPRIEDLEPMKGRLAALVPDLRLVTAHGKMPAAEVDEAIVGFADGRGDVLLATNIIESGLDVPRANTMMVCDADRFGLAQLHQLRGRVGRGRVQGVCYLLTDPERPVAEATLSRLGTLAAHDRLGAGMAISARDLDLRGAGELLGEEQSGHVNLVGLGLYQHLLELAIRAAKGEPVEDWTPEIRIEAAAALPAEYVPEEGVRLNLYARLARTTEPGAVDALADEIEDRFGPPPPAVAELLQVARLRALCRRWGVARVDAGPQALAYTLRPDAAAAEALRTLAEDDGSDLAWKGERLIQSRPTETGEERLTLAVELLESLE